MLLVNVPVVKTEWAPVPVPPRQRLPLRVRLALHARRLVFRRDPRADRVHLPPILVAVVIEWESRPDVRFPINDERHSPGRRSLPTDPLRLRKLGLPYSQVGGRNYLYSRGF